MAYQKFDPNARAVGPIAPTSRYLDPRTKIMAPGPQAPIRNRGGILSSLISEGSAAGGAAYGGAIGATAGSVVPFAGTAVGGLIGAGIGGLIGGFGGRLVENKVRDDRFDMKSLQEAAGEGALSGVFSAAGPALKVAKGAKVAATAAKGARGVDDAAKAATSLRAKGIGALDLKDELRAIPNAAERVATANKYGIQSGMKGLNQATAKMAEFESRLAPMLKGTKIPAKEATSALDEILKTSAADVAPATLRRTIESSKKAIAKATKDGVITGDELRAIRSKLGSGAFDGSSTAAKELKQEIYHAYGDIIAKNNKAARGILSEQHSIINLGAGLAERSKPMSLPIPAAFGRVKVPGAATVRDRAIDLASGIRGAAPGVPTGIAGQTARNLPGMMLSQAPRGLASAFGGGPTQEPPGAQYGPGGQYLGNEYAPQSLGQAMSADVAPEEEAYTVQQVMADVQRDPKNAKQYMDYYKFLKEEQKAGAGAAGAGANITKVTAQQYGLAQAGSQALQQLAGLLQSDPKVLGRTATPGRGLPIVGGYISNAAGTGEYDAIGYNIADSLLRLRTGAAANKSEVEKLQSQLMPRAGDSQATIQRKLAQLQAAFDGVLVNAGNPGAQEPGYAETSQYLGGAF